MPRDLPRRRAADVVVRKVRECVERSGHPRPGSKIVAAMSGGKDSFALAYGLTRLSREMGWKVIGAHVVVKTEGGEIGAEDVVEEQAGFLGIDVEILRPSKTVEEAVEEMRARKPCYACRTLRRIELGRLAESVGARYLALGHTLDDAAATVILSLLTGAPRIKLLGYTGGGREPLLVRPLVRCPEDVTERLAEELGVETVATEDVCPYREGNELRDVVEGFLNEVESRIPTVKGNVVGTAWRTLRGNR